MRSRLLIVFASVATLVVAAACSSALSGTATRASAGGETSPRVSADSGGETLCCW